MAESDDGRVSMNLEDGPTTGDGDAVRFVTTGFNDRAIQTALDATTRYGPIRIGPS